MKIAYLRVLAAALTLAAPEFAAADGKHAGHGAPGSAATASRTVDVIMNDMFFEPESISVKPGETVRFRIRNEGEFVHEFNIGTIATHADHQDEMQMMMDHGVLKVDSIDMAAAKAMQASMGHGMHDAPNSVLLEPGKSAEIVWTFPDQIGPSLEFACNVPGHYGSGMVGSFTASN